jgi:hypothetical protein
VRNPFATLAVIDPDGGRAVVNLGQQPAGVCGMNNTESIAEPMNRSCVGRVCERRRREVERAGGAWACALGDEREVRGSSHSFQTRGVVLVDAVMFWFLLNVKGSPLPRTHALRQSDRVLERDPAGG